MKYSEMTWKEIDLIEKDKCLFILPIGSCEQHGPHLPMNVDAEISLNLSEIIENNYYSALLPPVNYSCRSLPSSGGGYEFPGTLYVDSNIFISYLKSLLRSIFQNGAKNLIILNGHWENESCIFEAIEQLREEEVLIDIKVIAFSWWNLVSGEKMRNIFGEFDNWSIEHAGASETSLMMYFKPESVRINKMKDCISPPPEGIYAYPIPNKWKGNDGVLSKVEHVTVDMGKELYELLEQQIIKVVEEILYD
ncbi:creatininase family protein [Breznakia pachnodae]|uniref:Creatinine amidohydrolase n=1 Tax=Breznakia pachnodae TaxID=265178 RepID=A0ABU0E3Q5_9FIRM|nr:creatininase family protein [Breznakia pachnodae]MDQ0361532.1 creatinine amidohydrolase [Breznakia pachnodae]